MRGGSRSDELLLGALAAGGPVEQAAESAGVSVRTVYRRLADPVFAGRLAQARDELISSALGELVDCASEAVATLRALLRASDERVRHRRRQVRVLTERLVGPPPHQHNGRQGDLPLTRHRRVSDTLPQA